MLQLLAHQRERVDVVGAVVDGVLGILDGELSSIAVADVADEVLPLVAHDNEHAAE